MSDQTSTGIFGNPSASTDTYNIDWTTTCGCNYWPCICRGWGVWPWQPYVAKQYVELPPLWAKPNEAKARRLAKLRQAKESKKKFI